MSGFFSPAASKMSMTCHSDLAGQIGYPFDPGDDTQGGEQCGRIPILGVVREDFVEKVVDFFGMFDKVFDRDLIQCSATVIVSAKL
ncbi:MAG: hypothetical protein HY328_06610 [Chloroflexi bacterium]|nr:hypothetical protein [Chloroflexota bacterium]